MATMFKSVLVTSNSGGKGVTLTVICDPEFAGATIYCTKSGTNLSKTCPSTSPYEVTFTLRDSGTYTISGTVSGMEHSTTIDVDVDLEVELKYGFNWVEWVNASQNYTDSDFSDLDDLLSNEEAIRELMTIHDCVDILADSPVVTEDVEKILNNDLCAKWINLRDYALDTLYANDALATVMDTADKYGYGEWALMPQVPKMTSNIAPYGVASASEYDGQYVAYRVFDGDNSTEWSTSHPTNQWVGYTFTQPVAIAEFYILPNQAGITEANGCRVKNYRIEVSDDNFVSDITVVYSGQYLNSNANGDRIKIPNPISKKSIRCYVEDGWNAFVIGIKELQFYAWQPKGNVPIMTANNAPYGETYSNQTLDNSHPSYYLFDNNNGTICTGTSNGSLTALLVGYKFTNPICVKALKVGVSTIYYDKFVVKGSNDGSTWETIGEELTLTQTGGQVFNVDSDKYFIYVAINPTHNTSGSTSNYFDTKELQFYGRELSVSVPVMTGNTTPYGEAVAENIVSGMTAYSAFANNPNSYYSAPSGVTGGAVGYIFNDPSIIKKVVFSKFNGGVRNLIVKIQTHNGSSWEDLSTETLTNDGIFSFDINSLNNNIKGIRLYFPDVIHITNSYIHCFNQIQFYGLDYSEKEFEEGTTKKWLYDHGLKLDGIELEPLAFHGSGGTDSNEGYPLIPTTNNASSAYSAMVDKSGNNVTFGQIYVDKAYDLTNYSYLMLRVNTARIYAQGYAYQGIALRLSTTKVAGYTVAANADIAVQGGVTSADVSTGHTIKSLDVSAFNQSEYMFLYLKSTANIEFSELWLE